MTSGRFLNDSLRRNIVSGQATSLGRLDQSLRKTAQVPELTRSKAVKLNLRVSLRHHPCALSMPAPANSEIT
jgi:hypothetical protein